jgi:hypothetical protein
MKSIDGQHGWERRRTHLRRNQRAQPSAANDIGRLLIPCRDHRKLTLGSCRDVEGPVRAWLQEDERRLS